jgi:hypothetical protein
VEPEISRFDILFKEPGIADSGKWLQHNHTIQETFEKELGFKAHSGAWATGGYSAIYDPGADVKSGDNILTDPNIRSMKLLELFRKYQKDGLVEEGSAVQIWVDVETAEKILRGQ